MAELCLKCFLETCCPDEYDRANIVMSQDNEFCERCMGYGPYVDHIGMTDFVELCQQACPIGYTNTVNI